MNDLEIRKQILSATKNLDAYKGLVIQAAEGQPSYYNANEAVLNFYPEVREAVLRNTGGARIKLSPGISTVPTLPEFVSQTCRGIGDPNLYVNYSAPFGTTSAVSALRKVESASLTSTKDILYPANGIYITSGGTEAVNLAYEYVRQLEPGAKAAVLGLSYYIFPFVSARLGMDSDTLIADSIIPSKKTAFLPKPEEVAEKLGDKTKMLIAVQPTNPTGEYYTREDIEKLVSLAVERNLLILSDNAFSDLVYEPEKFATFEQVAFEKGELDRILTVRSYSKNYNVPGLRIGYLATSNPEVGRDLSFISERIKCCPPTVFSNLINFVSLMQNIDIDRKRDPEKPTRKVIGTLNPEYDFGQGPNPNGSLEKKYRGYRKFMDQMLDFYGRNFDLIGQTLADDMVAGNDKNAAFNTLAKIRGIGPDTNFFDFCVNLYMTCGVETQIGPCFGLGQRRWEEDLGFWLRVTYTLPPEDLARALRTVTVFRDVYQDNPKQFIETGMRF